MRKIIFYQEEQKLGFGLHGSKSRCSISSRSFVLLNDDKKRGQRRLGKIFKRIGKWILRLMDIILALSTLIGFALLIKNYLGW